jgi:Na+/proline symporter
VDHIIVQRLLASKSLRDARKALITSGFIVIGQFAIFLLVGVMLYQFYEGRQFGSPDEIFPRFIVDQMPAGIRGLVIAGILAAAMSTVASSLNSLASSTTHDIYAPLAKVTDDVKLMQMGKRFTLIWGVILIGGAMLFQFVQQGTPVVVIALEIASFTYGGLLGGFLLAVFSKRAEQTDAIIGMGTAIVAMASLWAVQKFGGIDPIVNGLWFALIGSVITLAVGTLSAMLRGSRGAGAAA